MNFLGEIMLKKNLGTTERVIRLIIAALFLVLYATGVVSGTLGIILLVLAFIMALTSLLSFCPLYYLFKFSTLKK